jgi:hypothetical protein
LSNGNKDDIFGLISREKRERESHIVGVPFWRRKLLRGDFGPGGDRDLLGTRFYPFTLLMILQKID